MSVAAPPMGLPKTQPHMRRMDVSPNEMASIDDARPLTVEEWKRRIAAYAERIGVQRSKSAIRRMAQKVARDAQPGTDPDRVVAGLFEQHDEPDPEPRLDHLDPYDPRIRFIPWSDHTGEEASTNVDKERAA